MLSAHLAVITPSVSGGARCRTPYTYRKHLTSNSRVFTHDVPGIPECCRCLRQIYYVRICDRINEHVCTHVRATLAETTSIASFGIFTDSFRKKMCRKFCRQSSYDQPIIYNIFLWYFKHLWWFVANKMKLFEAINVSLDCLRDESSYFKANHWNPTQLFSLDNVALW